MNPPTYGDLGKASRDLFSKGYHFGIFKLDCKTKTKGGVEINSGGNHSFEESKVFGTLETKYKCEDYGLTISEKWNTGNLLSTESTCQDKIAKGVKIGLESLFNPDTGKKSGKLKTEVKHSHGTCNVSLDGDDNKTAIVHAAFVLGYNGFLGGYQMNYDAMQGKIGKNNFAFGYQTGDFQVHGSVDNGETYNGSFYQTVSNRLETGVQIAWTSGAENSTKFSFGGRYLLDPWTALRAKVNNQSEVGLGFEQRLRQGVTLTLSTYIDGKNFKAGGHKIGVGLELEP